MQISASARLKVLIAMSLLCLGGSVYLSQVSSLFYLVALSFLTIMLPLISSLYVYRGKPAQVWLVLASIGTLCALVFAADTTATLHTFKAICDGQGPGHDFLNRGIYDGYVCTAPSEPDYIHMQSAMSPISIWFMWPYLALLFVNLGHVPYLAWRSAKKFLSKRTQK